MPRHLTPRSFEEVIGHDSTLTALTRAFAGGRSHHAYLFTGPDGVGKTTVARILGQSILCRERRPGHPCHRCEQCIRVAAQSHPDWLLIEPDGQNIKIGQIRQLTHSFAYRAFEGGRRVALITAAERMTEEAANALLKSLEEPPNDSVFLVVTANKSRLLPTIVSRCQQVAFSPLPPDAVAQVLLRQGVAPAAPTTAKHAIGPGHRDALNERSLVSQAQQAARYSGGSPGRAAMLLNDDTFLARESLVQAFVNLRADTVLDFGVWSEPARPAGKGKKLAEQRTVTSRALEILQVAARDIMLLKAGGDPGMLVNQDMGNTLSKHAQQLTWPHLSAILESLRVARQGLEGNVTPRLVLENLAAVVVSLRE